MKNNSPLLDLTIRAAEKIDSRSAEWENLRAFIRSCYGGLVLTYDLDAALAALARLTDAEQNALITWTLLLEERTARKARPQRSDRAA